MKRKLIVTLVATALELYAAAATAQVGTCTIAGTSKSANNATPVTAGPLNPVDGFPEYVTDSTGVSLQRCLNPDWCFFDPIVTTDPFSIQIGSGGEAFYWGADVILNNQAGLAVFKLVMAAETAFLGDNPATGGPQDGTQFPFLRFRYVFDAPADGVYTLTHPYGTEKFEVTGATGNRDIFVSYDRGLTANQTITGNVGPFLTSATIPAPGFLGNGGAAAVADLASGGPCFASPEGFNSVTLTGIDSAGAPIDFGGGQTSLSTDLFTIQGQIYDGKVQTPVNAARVTYSRSAAGAGQVEAFAASTTAAAVSVIDGPTIPAGSSRIPAALTLDHATVTPTDAAAPEGINSLAVPVLDASALPPVVTLTANDTTLAASGARLFDSTSQNMKLVDFVDITQADFDPATGVLTVSATSGDKRLNPALTVRDLGAINAATTLYTTTTLAPPAVVHVDSAAGGTATAQVRVIAAVPPVAPSVPVLDAASARAVQLSWSDNSDNEAGFRIYTVDTTTGARTLVGSAPANAHTAVVTGLAIATTFTFQVEAFNGVGAASSETLVASTLALPAAPATASFTLSNSVQRRIDLVWDASAGATSYQVSRRVGTGAFVVLGTVTGTSFADLNGVASTTYTYQVVAQRSTIATITDSSTATTSNTVTTPGAPTSTTQPVATVSGQNVTLSYNDRSTNEIGFQVYRRLNGGAYAPITPVETSNSVAAINVAKSLTDNNLAFGVYNYRVDVSNWATTVQSAVSANVNIANLLAPTNLTADTNARPTVAWTDNAVAETGYRAVRTPLTVAANGSVTVGAATTLNFNTPNTTTFREANGLNNGSYRYVVTALNGATVGAAGTVQTVVGALPTVGNPALVRSLVGAGVNATARVTVNWTARTETTVGGYEIQRCTGATCTNFVKVTGAAVNTDGTVDGRATATFQDNTVARGTTYRYRLRAIGGGKPSALGAFNATIQNVTTQ